MGVRKKGRAKFEHSGRQFVWWVDNDTYIRIASEDKSFVVAYLLYSLPEDVGGLVAVKGKQFVGLSPSDQRPVWLIVPEDVSNYMHDSMGAFVNALLTWSFDPSHELEIYEGETPRI